MPTRASVDLSLERTPEGLRLIVADDGVGIGNLDDARSISHGMAGMMHRVRSIGGTFEVVTRANEGTRIEVFVPLKA